MRKNFERIIFAVSVCVLCGVLFVQAILYLKDLGFVERGTPVSLTFTQEPRKIAVEPGNSEDEFQAGSFLSEASLEPVELALAESEEVEEDSAELTSDDSLLNGPLLRTPGVVVDEYSDDDAAEQSDPEPPILAKPLQDFLQTPGPLMPPLNAEPLADSEKRSAARDDKMTRSIIREHLPDATEDELQIWFEELRGVPHKVASDLLSIRKLLQPKGALRTTQDKWAQLQPSFEALPPQQPVSTTQKALPDQSGFIGFSSKADRDELQQRLRPTVDALRLSRDVIVNNIANAGTIGFKRLYVEFESLPYEYVKTPASEESETEPPIAVGMGSQVLQTRISQTSGELLKTGRELDIAIEGQGFLQVRLGETTAYTRTGRLMFDEDGRLCIRGSQHNYLIVPEIKLPAEAYSLQISESGIVTALLADAEKEVTAGELQIACFTDASELFPRESCLFTTTPRAGVARVLTPGTKGAGQIRSGALEASNVSIVEELEQLSLIKQRLDALKTVYLTEPDEPVQADLGLPAERIARPQTQQLPQGNRSIIK
ncbi:flagellar hook-basal body complex protein [Gimesia sp.]|uniref:flagellar hook-basal body protein n=1 Tax=Gimesia sp. TaxID=2024833 RepID=UPI0025C07A08|nr:flagellar hook-basal body complex protein [Gimesia sp.]